MSALKQSSFFTRQIIWFRLREGSCQTMNGGQSRLSAGGGTRWSIARRRTSSPASGSVSEQIPCWLLRATPQSRHFSLIISQPLLAASLTSSVKVGLRPLVTYYPCVTSIRVPSRLLILPAQVPPPPSPLPSEAASDCFLDLGVELPNDPYARDCSGFLDFALNIFNLKGKYMFLFGVVFLAQRIIASYFYTFHVISKTFQIYYNTASSYLVSVQTIVTLFTIFIQIHLFRLTVPIMYYKIINFIISLFTSK